MLVLAAVVVTSLSVLWSQAVGPLWRGARAMWRRVDAFLTRAEERGRAVDEQLLGRADGNGKEPTIHDAIADLGAQVCEIQDELHEFQIEVRRLL